MKKKIALLLTAILFLGAGLTGCSQAAAQPDNTTSEPAPISVSVSESAPELIENVGAAFEQSDINNFKEGGFAAIDGEWIYWRGEDSLVRMRVDGTGEERLDFEIFTPFYAEDGWIFSYDNNGIFRVRPNGSEREYLVVGVNQAENMTADVKGIVWYCDVLSMVIDDGYIYFWGDLPGEDGHSVHKDGYPVDEWGNPADELMGSILRIRTDGEELEAIYPGGKVAQYDEFRSELYFHKEFTVSKGYIFFYDGTYVKADGSETGTFIVSDNINGPGGAGATGVRRDGDWIYLFTAWDGAWRAMIDGSGQEPVYGHFQTEYGSYVVADGYLYFMENGEGAAPPLYKVQIDAIEDHQVPPWQQTTPILVESLGLEYEEENWEEFQPPYCTINIAGEYIFIHYHIFYSLEEYEYRFRTGCIRVKTDGTELIMLYEEDFDELDFYSKYPIFY